MVTTQPSIEITLNIHYNYVLTALLLLLRLLLLLQFLLLLLPEIALRVLSASYDYHLQFELADAISRLPKVCYTWWCEDLKVNATRVGHIVA